MNLDRVTLLETARICDKIWEQDSAAGFVGSASSAACAVAIRALAAQHPDRIAELESVIGRCHEAIGENAASDDDTLPDSIALHITEARQHIAELEAKIKRAMPSAHALETAEFMLFNSKGKDFDGLMAEELLCIKEELS